MVLINLLDPSKSEELLPVTLRNVSTMQSYIREALFFSQNHTPRLEPGRSRRPGVADGLAGAARRPGLGRLQEPVSAPYAPECSGWRAPSRPW